MRPDYAVDENGCWIWQKALGSEGYGQCHREGRNRGAHRVYFEKAKGPIPSGWVIHHLCEVRACCNPDHLEAMESMAHQSHHHPIKVVPELKHCEICGKRLKRRRGERPAAFLLRRYCNLSCSQHLKANKISPDDVLKIREQLKAGAKQKDLSQEYGVSQSSISRVKTGFSWAVIP